MFVLELIGTAVFAISGAMVAVRRRLDLFGVMVLALSTAVGGGIIRDLILGNTPPATFTNPVYALVALASATVVFVAYNRIYRQLRAHRRSRRVLNSCLSVLDAVGLGIFTVVGVNVAIAAHGQQGTAFLSIFVGVMTGCGGGILRDLLANRTPVVLRRDIYACASLAGAVVYFYLLRAAVAQPLAITLSVLLVLGIRLLAIWRHLHLPLVRLPRYTIKSGEKKPEIENEHERE